MSHQRGHESLDGIEYLNSLRREIESKRVLLVTGVKSFSDQTYVSEIKNFLKDIDHTHLVFEGSNPTDGDLEDCFKKAGLPECSVDLVFSIGGGSVIDMGKLLANHLFEVKGQFPEIWAIPTTAGTGSESTQFATYYVEGKKRSVDKPELLPSTFVLDARFVTSLPKPVAVSTGLDAYCQAVESYWSCSANEESTALAREAIQFSLAHLGGFILKRNSENSLGALMAANRAGRAIQITRTTAAHALSYTMTFDHGIPHGNAVALTLGELADRIEVMDESACIHPLGISHVRERLTELRKVLGISSISFREHMDLLLEKLDIHPRLHSYGIEESDLIGIAEDACRSGRMQNCPLDVNVHIAHDILKSVY